MAYCRLQVPDLELAERFLVDTGLISVVRENGRRYFRATGGHPYSYVLEEGLEHFLGFALHANAAPTLMRWRSARAVR